MKIKQTASNIVFIAILLMLGVSIISILNSQTRLSSQSASAPLEEPTLLPEATLSSLPTPDATEIAEGNLPAIAPVVTPVPPQIEAQAGVANLRPFVTEGHRLFLGWSPDGLLALVRKNTQNYDFVTHQYSQGFGAHATLGDLWVVDTNGNDRMKISDAVGIWVWSPDSKSVLFTEPIDPKGESEAYLLIANLDSGQIQRIAQTDEFVTGSPNIQWLPTGHIFFRRGNSLYRINPDGTDESLATPLNFVSVYAEDQQGNSVPGTGFSICPDESRIAYTLADENGISNLWLANLDRSDAVQVTDSTDFEWNLDCTQLVLSHAHKYQGTGYDSSIMIVDRDGKNLKEVVPVSEQDDVNTRPQWAGVGNWIIYLKRVPHFDPNGRLEIQIWKVDPDSGKTVSLVQHAGWEYYLSASGGLAFNAQIASIADNSPNTLNAFIVQIDLSK